MGGSQVIQSGELRLKQSNRDNYKAWLPSLAYYGGSLEVQ